MKVDFRPSYISYKATQHTQLNVGAKNLLDSPLLLDLRELGNNSYFGLLGYSSNRTYHKHRKSDFEQAGIKHIITISNDVVTTSQAKEDGFDCINLAFDSFDRYMPMPWLLPPFKNKDEWEHREPIGEIHIQESYEKLSREFIDKFTSFIHCLQDGHCYIEGREEHDIESIFILNKFFNPKEDQVTPPLQLRYTLPKYMTSHMRTLYAALTDEDKAKMGWTKDFDKTFLQKIKNAENLRITMDKKYASQF